MKGCPTCLAAVPQRAAPQPSQFTLRLRGPPGAAPLLYDRDGDTDRDGWNDSYEVKPSGPFGWITDPATNDTDGDGVEDDDDLNPLGNAMIEFKPTWLKLKKDDVDGTGDNAGELYFVVSVGDVHSAYLNTSRRTDAWEPSIGFNQSVTFNDDSFKLTIDVPDDAYMFKIEIEVWDLDGSGYDDGDDSGSEDDWLDLSTPEYYEGDNWWGTSKGLSIKWNTANNTIFCEDTDGDIEGPDVHLKYELDIVGHTIDTNEGIYAWIIVPKSLDENETTPQLLHRVTMGTETWEDDRYRFIGNSRFYVLQLNVTEDGASIFDQGFHTIVIPEGVFYDTELFYLLNATDQADVSTNLSFLPAGDTAWQAPTPGSASASFIVNILVVKLNATQAYELEQALRANGTNDSANLVLAYAKHRLEREG